MNICALCNTEILDGDNVATVVVAMTGQGVATGPAHSWCADALQHPVAPVR